MQTLSLFLLLLLCVPTLFAVGWVHYRLRAYPAGTRRMSGLILLVVGASFGGVTATIYLPTTGIGPLLVFLSAFGLVHVPAACILQLKHWHGRDRVEESDNGD